MRRFLSDSWLVLVLGTCFSVALAATQTALAPRIEANRRAALTSAVFEVVPGTVRYTERRVGLRSIYECFDAEGTSLGWAIPASDFGFQDQIDVVFGLSLDGASILGLSVVDNKETPGLGNRIVEDAWRAQYAGLDTGQAVTVVKRPRRDESREVQAISGATISSQAVTRIVNDTNRELVPELRKGR
jgi:electron transport complex protein RnfG